MVLTMRVLDGNPTDSTLVSDTLEDLQSLYGKAPTAMAFDGCFASVANRDAAKAAGVDDVTFRKNGNMKLSTLVSSTKLNRLLRNFRAGIEGCISFLKRTFGFSRVIDRSLETFNAALHMGAFAYNITLLARMCIAERPSP
jgi:IS5 family transposase